MNRAHKLTLALIALAILLTAAAPAVAATGKVNVNQAGTDELALLPRVGPAVSQRIVEFRDANGPFRSSEELMLVRGIGEKTFALIEPYVTLEGETTLTEKVRAGRAAAGGDGEDTAADG